MIALEQEGKDKQRERVHTTGSAKNFQYEESLRRATYAGDAHMNGPQGDMTAEKIELYLKPSGDEIERVEAYEAVTLHDRIRETRGARMTYFGAEENIQRLERARMFARQHHVTVAQVALAYVLCQPLHPFAVVGCTTLDKFAQNVAAVSLRLDEATLHWLATGQASQ